MSQSLFGILMRVYLWQLGNRDRFLRWTNPLALQTVDRPTAESERPRYLETHRNLMRGWAYLGNAPHMDLMALAALTGRFDVYFAARIVLFSALAVALSLRQRQASRAFFNSRASSRASTLPVLVSGAP